MEIDRNLADSELLQLIKADQEPALVSIYRRYWEKLFTAAFNILKDRQACEDIIQEIFIKVWAKRKELEITSSLRAYLHASVRYEVYRQIRSGAVREDLFDDLIERLHSPSVDANVELKELQQQVSSIVETLPEKCREVYKLSREEQLSHKEIAARLNISPKTVENHLTKALRTLRVGLGEAITAQLLFILLNN